MRTPPALRAGHGTNRPVSESGATQEVPRPSAGRSRQEVRRRDRGLAVGGSSACLRRISDITASDGSVFRAWRGTRPSKVPPPPRPTSARTPYFRAPTAASDPSGRNGRGTSASGRGQIGSDRSATESTHCNAEATSERVKIPRAVTQPRKSCPRAEVPQFDSTCICLLYSSYRLTMFESLQAMPRPRPNRGWGIPAVPDRGGWRLRTTTPGSPTVTGADRHTRTLTDQSDTDQARMAK